MPRRTFIGFRLPDKLPGEEGAPVTDGETDQALLDELRERASRAAQAWTPGASVQHVEPLTGGSSSLTFTLTIDGVADPHRTVVLKVAPPGLPPVRNRDVLRQATLMRALAGQHGVRVPVVLFQDAGSPPETPPFVAMEWVDGECVEPALTDPADRDPALLADIRARAFDAAHMLAAMHSLDPANIGLAGEPVVSLSAEVDRWTRALETVPEDLQGNYRVVAAALHDTTPPALTPVVNHGDYRLGNTLCVGPEVRAVIDWEIWSLGDPRVDASWLTFFCDDQKHPAAADSSAPSGMPTTDELLSAYLEARGTTLPDLDWFKALTRYKETGATALLIKRARKSGQLVDAFQRMTAALPQMLAEALELVGR
jgi:aminoglycoside phosphotransferase (APT) family kinase protein